MKQWKRLLGIFMSGAVLITGGVLPQKNAAAAEGATDYGISSPRIENGVTTWDKIKFGSYYQDAEVQPAEPIKWRVLSVDGDDAFLLADKNLDCKQYNEKRAYVTWKTCTLRKWLNEDFYNEAFDAEEKKAVKETTVVNEDNTRDVSDTKDRVYLLSASEACNAAYGFDTEFGTRSKTREAKNTDYAKANNAYTSIASDMTGTGCWWLRSSRYYSLCAMYVFDDGYGTIYGDDVNYNYYAVRPVLHINLKSAKDKVKDAGEVDSAGNVTASGDGIKSPRTKDGVTTWDCVYFGSYRQNFSVKQEIEWRVLSVDGDDAFLLADRNLVAKAYNEESISVTWETCTLRKWLNEDFYNETFDAREKKVVKETTIVNEDNLIYDTEGGSDTKDKVYLLSISEACNAAYGFDTEFDKESKTRKVKDAGYAKVNKASRNNNEHDMVSKAYWWLRSPGNVSSRAAYVYDDGRGISYGRGVDYGTRGVRPALHINLSSSVWSKAGTVSSDGIVVQPTEKPQGTPVPTPDMLPPQTPYVDIQGGLYASPQSVSITADSGADVYYTVDGTEPDAANGILYTEPVFIRNSGTLKAVAVKNGVCSDVLTEDYTIMESRDSVMIDGYTIYVTDTSGKPIYNARIVIGVDSGSTDRDGRYEFSSIKGWKGEDGSSTFNINVQAGGYSEYIAYDCAVSENHTMYVTMLTISEADDSGTSLLKNDLLEGVLYKDALFGNVDLLVNKKTISLSEPDKTFDMTVKVRQDKKEIVNGYSIWSGNKKVAYSKDGCFENIKYSVFEADKKVYIQLDVDPGQGDIKRAATQRQRINLSVKNPGESVKESYGSISLGDNLSFKVSEDIPFVGGTEFNLAKLDLPIDMKFSTDGEFVLSINADEEEIYKTKKGILFKDFDDEALKEKKEESVVDDIFFGRLKDALASSSENLEQGKDDNAYKEFELKFSDDFRFTTKIGGYISGRLNESCKKGTGNLYILAKAGYKGEMQTIIYAIPIVISIEVGAEGKMSATINADFTDSSKKIGECIDGELLFSLNPYIKAGVGPGCKEMNVKLKGGFELPINYYMLGDKKGLQSISLKANAAVSGKVFGFEKEWEFWNDELAIYNRAEWPQKQKTALYKEMFDGLWKTNAPLSLYNADVKSELTAEQAGLKEPDISDIAAYRSWNNNSLYTDGSPVLNERVSNYTDTETVAAGDTVLMVYSDVDADRDAYNSDALYYSLYDKTSGCWGEPLRVDSNNTPDYGFDIYSDGTDIYLVYQEMNRNLTRSDSLEDMAGCTRITYARFNPDTGNFEDFQYMSDGDGYVFQPSIIGNNGGITVGWIENTAKEYYALNNTNKIVARTLSGGIWSDTVTYLEGSCKIMELQGCVLDGRTYLAYVTDRDNNLQTSADRDIYLADPSGTVITVTSDEVQDANLMYGKSGENMALYWYKGNAIMYLSSAGGIPEEVSGEISISPNEDFRMISDGSGRQAILFTHNDSNDSSDVVEAYIMYQEAGGKFGFPVRVTDCSSYVSGYSGALINGDMLINYRLDDYIGEGDSFNVRSSLHSSLIHDFSKVSLLDLTYEYDGMQKGKSLVLEADVKNEGSHRIDELKAEVFNPSGENVGMYTIQTSIEAGQRAAVTFAVDVPMVLEDGMYTLSLKENNCNEAEAGNYSFRLLYSELKIKAEQITIGENVYISAVVENRGDLPTNAAIDVVNANVPDRILTSVETGQIAGGGYKTSLIPITGEMLSDKGVYSAFILSVRAEREERYQYDNNVTIEVDSQVRAMELNHERLDLIVNDKMSLEVAIDALGNPEFEYEWSSSDKAVATVDGHGEVCAVGEGEVVITAMTKQGDFAECSVRVRKQAAIPTETPKPTNKPSETASPTPTATLAPTNKPVETATPAPTATLEPTNKPVETATPAPTATLEPTNKPVETASPTKTPEPTEKPTVTAEPTKEPGETDKPTASPEPTKIPEATNSPTTPTDPTKTPASTDNPITPTEPTQTSTATAQPTPPTVTTQNPIPAVQPVLKQLKLSSVKCTKNAKKITGKVSVSRATIKIKVGRKAYKKAKMKGKKFTLKLNYKLKKKTKIKIKVEKKGYKSLIKSYTVK